MKNKLILSVIIYFSLTINVFSSPLTFMDLDWTMSKETLQKKIEEKGYKCGTYKSLYSTYLGCESGQKLIFVYEDYLEFFCESFDGCTFDYKQIAQSVADKFSIDLIHSETTNGKFYPNFSGNGPDGDKISILNTERGVTVWLFKGSLGKKLNF